MVSSCAYLGTTQFEFTLKCKASVLCRRSVQIQCWALWAGLFMWQMSIWGTVCPTFCTLWRGKNVIFKLSKQKVHWTSSMSRVWIDNMRCSLLTNQGPGAASTHAAQHCGCGADLWRYQVRPDSDTAVSQLLRGHHEQLLCWGGRPSAQWWRSFAVLWWKQLHYIHEGRGWQVRGIKGLK